MTTYLRLLSLAILLALCQTATAQHDAFGARGGANFSQFTGSDVSGSKSTFGYHAGLFYHYSIKKNLGFQPELLWSTQGERRELKTKVANITYNQRLSYVQMPLLLAYTSGDFDGFQLMVGPAISYLAWAQLKTETKAQGVDKTVATENKEDFPELDLSLQGGIGWLFGGLSIQVRGNYGLLKVSEQDHDIHNMTLMLSVGLEF